MVKLLGSYQQNTVDAFDNEINAVYVDGVSLTHGTPRNHMWTFAAALHEFMITIAQRIHAHVLIFATLHSQQYLGLLVMTTFVTLGVKMKSITSSMERSSLGWCWMWSIQHMLFLELSSMVQESNLSSNQ